MMGPIKKAIPNTAPIIPNALPRRSTGNTSPTTARATGNIPPAPKHWMARPISNIVPSFAVATIIEPIPNNTTLAKKL